MVWLASALTSAYIMQLAVCVCVSHHMVDVTAGLPHLLLRLEQPTKQHRSLHSCVVRCAVSCCTLETPTCSIKLHRSQSPLCRWLTRRQSLAGCSDSSGLQGGPRSTAKR